MIEQLVRPLYTTLNDVAQKIPPGLVLCLVMAFIEGGKYRASFQNEFIGTLLMIACTFSAGKWIGQQSQALAWGSHFLGVIVADYSCGGPHVNPAMTVSMFTLGKCSYTDAVVRIMGQMAGGFVAFPLFALISETLKWEHFGGPEYPDGQEPEAFISEFTATLLLCFLIYLVNWELNFGRDYHYIIKQSLTAIGIRTLIECFPTAGPAMNPMLATGWDTHGVGNQYEIPMTFGHYFVYWVGPFLAAILASAIYTVYAGGTVFGRRLPIGPIKASAPWTAATTTRKKKQ